MAASPVPTDVRGERENLLRFHRSTPSAWLGLHQWPERELRLLYCHCKGIDVVRRLTGGGALYVDPRQLGFSLILKWSERFAVIGEAGLPMVLIDPGGTLPAMNFSRRPPATAVHSLIRPGWAQRRGGESCDVILHGGRRCRLQPLKIASFPRRRESGGRSGASIPACTGMTE